jgi:carbonic anhydrase/acetyltransferase-like protein (isoleucine patch superfamily)
VDPTAFVAAQVQIHGDVTLAARVVVMFGAVLRADLDRIEVGEESNIQDNCVVHVDEGFPAIIGRRVTVGHAAVVHGARIGDHALVGIGALILNGATLGEGAWLAAGSVLPEGRSIDPWTLAVGVPARPLRALRDDEIRRQDEGIDHYLALADRYR